MTFMQNSDLQPMNHNHPMKKTEIAFILDRSGSMQSMTNAAISGFNEFLKAQQGTLDDHGMPIPATFTLILFDHEYLPVYNRQDIQTARPLTLETYVPRGNTASTPPNTRRSPKPACNPSTSSTSSRTARLIPSPPQWS